MKYIRQFSAVLLILFGMGLALLLPHHVADVNSSEDPDSPEMREWLDSPPVEYEEPKGGWVYGYLRYLHHIIKPDYWHMKLLAHPESKVPDIIGSFAFTDVGVNIQLRGITAPRALQNAEELHRPHEWRKRERARWDRAMRYMWSITEPTKTFRVHNLEKLDDRTIEADVEVLLGGEWRDVAVMMVKDEIVRPSGIESEWDAGTREFGMLNPEVPK